RVIPGIMEATVTLPGLIAWWTCCQGLGPRQGPNPGMAGVPHTSPGPLPAAKAQPYAHCRAGTGNLTILKRSEAGTLTLRA
ncbi:hypothetical protein DSO57_1038505, partial [Entomophthora muscae]